MSLVERSVLELDAYDDDCAIATDDLWEGSRVVFLRGLDRNVAWLRTGRLHRRA